MKYWKNQKGSTLMLVVITVAILSMLGTALLSMSLMNVNMKQNDYRIKKTAYYAESGIDQVYARIGKLVGNAIENAIVETDVQTKIILSEIDIMLETSPPTNDVPRWTLYGIYVKLNGVGDYMLDTEKLQEKTETIYRKAFRDYLNGLNNNADLTDDVDYYLTNPGYFYLDSNDPSTNSYITITIDPTKINEFSGEGTEFAIRGITSKFDYGDRVEKQITTDIVILDTISSYPMNTLEKRMIVPNNPLWKQAIVAYENIDFNSTNATINGDMYGYGTIPADTSNATAFGGVIADGNSDIIVNGNIYSRSYVQLGGSTADLTVNNGLIYANSVVIQKSATGRMSINGQVYTSDDLEHNGTGGDLVINGSYYGYTTNATLGSTHDASSAIVINADMSSGSGSTLIIDGRFNRVTNSFKPDIDYMESSEGILIGGTAYIDSQPERYQTAESVSIKGNFVAYTWGFDNQLLVDNIYGTNIFTSGHYNFYNNIATQDQQVEDNLLKENVDWQSINGTTVRLAKGTTVIGGQSTLSDRKAYFTAFKEFVDNNSGTFVKGGTPTSVKLDHYIYTTGLQLSGNDFVFDANEKDQTEYERLRIKITDDYLYQLHKLKYRDGGIAHEKMGEVEGVTVGGLNNQTPTVGNINIIEKYTTLDTETYNYTSVPISVDSVISPGTGVIEIKHVSDGNDTFYIYGGGYAGTVETNSISGSDFQGIIVNGGDVEIYGNVRFVGTILSGGNIITHGGNQSFHNYTNDITTYLAKLIYSDDVLYKTFNTTNYAGVGSASINLGNLEFVEIENSQPTFDSNNNNVYAYNEMIHFEHWKIAK